MKSTNSIKSIKVKEVYDWMDWEECPVCKGVGYDESEDGKVTCENCEGEQAVRVSPFIIKMTVMEQIQKSTEVMNAIRSKDPKQMTWFKGKIISTTIPTIV